MDRFEIAALEQPPFKAWRLCRDWRRELLRVSLFDRHPSPMITRTIPDNRQQPAWQLRLIDSGEVPVQRQECLRRQVFGSFPVTNEAPGETKDRLHVAAVKGLEGIHGVYG
jgi:hypothetical protein